MTLAMYTWSRLQADRFDDLGQQLAGAADERLALLVFVGAGRLADEHQVGVRDCRRRTRPACGRACAACSACRRGRSRPSGVSENGRDCTTSAVCRRDRRRTGARRLGIVGLAPGRSPRDAPRRVAADAVDTKSPGRSADDRRDLRATCVIGRATRDAGRASQECSTRSRIRAAIAALLCSGTSSTPSRETSVTALVSTSKPTPGCDTSLATMRSTPLRSSFCRARARRRRAFRRQTRRAAADPRRARDGSWPRSARMSLRAFQRQHQRPVALRHLLRGGRRPACSRRPPPPSPRHPRPPHAPSRPGACPRRCAPTRFVRRAAASRRGRAR